MDSSGALAPPQNSSHPFGDAFRSLSFAHACDEFLRFVPERVHYYTTLKMKIILKKKKFILEKYLNRYIGKKMSDERKENDFPFREIPKEVNIGKKC